MNTNQLALECHSLGSFYNGASCTGLVVMGRDSHSEGHEFESHHHIRDGIFDNNWLPNL